MADAQANIGIGVDISSALAQIRQLQREISAFHTSMAKGGALANAESARLSQNLINTINAGGKFSAGMTQISSSTESFTNALEKNKLSMTQYFRYAGGASRSFGKMFSREFGTINRVAMERVKDLQTQYISMGRDANGALQSIKVRPLALDMNDLGTKVQMVAQRQQIFNQLLKQGSTNLLNFGKNTQWAGRQLMVGFTIPLTIFGATAAREFQKLEEQAVKFRRVYGDMFTTDAETEKALSNIRELADEFTKYGIAVEKTVGLAAKVAQMGNMGTDLTAQVTQATRLAVLGGLEQEEALDTTISLTNAFGIAAEDLAGKIAFLNAAENQTILAIEDFNEAIPKAGSVVQQLGGDVEDLAFMLTAMREGGINASQAANAIKSSLGRMINPTEAAKQKLAGFGIDIMGIVENNAGNLQATIMQLGYALDNLDPLERARAIETLFGKFQFARMSTMFQNIVKDGSQANKVLGLTANSTEELAIIAERELKRVEDSVGFKFQKQIEKLQAALAPIGEEFLKAITPVVEFGTKLLKSFNNLGEGGKQFIVVLTAIAGVVAPAALMAFGLIANGVANLIKFFALLGRGFGMLSGQSKILGTGTEYMTQQQIEAAAVAASLGQSHSNLIQVFSAEAVAVNNLANAYRQAIIAQGAFRGTGAAAAGTIPKPRGYASGGLIVGPGSGTSDSIPAMVSNGEFIMNAERTKQYLPLLQLMAKGKVPGYASPGGASIVGESPRQAAQRQATRIMGKNPGEAAVVRLEKFFRDLPVEEVEAALNRLKDASATTAEQLKAVTQDLQDRRTAGAADRTQQAHLGNPGRTVPVSEASAKVPGNRTLEVMSKVDPNYGVEEKHSWVRTLGENANRDMGIRADQIKGRVERGETVGYSAAALSAELGSETEEQSLLAYSEGLEATGTSAEDPEIRSDLLAYDKRIKQILADRLEENANLMILDTEEQIAQLPEDQKANYVSMESIEAEAAKPLEGTKLGAHRTVAQEIPREYRKKVTQDFIDKANQARDDGTITQEEHDLLSKKVIHPEAKKRNLNVLVGKKDKAKATREAAQNLDSLTEESKQKFFNLGEGLVEGAEGGWREEAQQHSPSKKFFDLGSGAADSLANGFESGMADEVDPLAPPKAPEVGYMPDDNSLRGRLRGLGNRAADKFNDSKIGQGIGKKFSDMTGTPLADSQGNLVYDPDAAIASGAPMPVRIVEGFEIDPEFQRTMEEGTARTEDLADTIAENTGTVDRNSQEQKEINKQNKRQNRQALAGKMMAGLGGITMAAGMATQVEGVVGETAQSLVGPLAGITAILPMLTAMGPLWGTLLGVIGAGVSLWMLHNAAVKKAREEAYDLARAMGAGKDAIQKFADFSGKVTSSEIAERQRSQRQNILQLQPGQKTFGSAFIEDEAGQELVENTKKSLQRFGKDATVKDIYVQLGNAVLAGALDAAQARSIAAALGQELEDYGLGMSVNGKLIDLLGPNGEKLLDGEPLILQTEIATEAFEAGAEKIARTFQSMGELDANVVVGTEDIPVIATRSEDQQAMIDAERKRQMDEAKASGSLLQQFLVGIKFDSQIADQLQAEGAAQASGIFANNLEVATQQVDAQRVASQEAIDKAIEEGAASADIAELKRKEAAAIVQVMDKLEEANSGIFEWWSTLPKSEQDENREAQQDRIITKAEEEGNDPQLVRRDLVKLNSGSSTEEERQSDMVIRTAVESGGLSLDALNTIVENFDNPEDKEIVTSLITEVGPGETNNLINLIKNIEDDELRGKVMVGFDGAETEEALEKISDLDYILRTSEIFDGDIDIPIRFFTEGEGDLKDTMDMADEVRALSEQGGLFDEGGNLDFGAYADVVGEDVAARAKVAADAIGDEFDALDEAEKLEFFTNFAINAQFSGDPDAIAFAKSQATELGLNLDFGASGSKQEQTATDITLGRQNYNLLPQMKDTTTPPGTDEGEGDGSGGGQKENYDDILVGLRNVRQATIDMKRGWDGMNESIQKFLDTGSVGFNGLANQMRRLGVGEGLIERITGMDPDEYEKRKGELFVFDEAGNIIGTTQKLKNLSLAMNSLALGEYMNSQQQFIENTQNQFTAMQKLTAAGLSFVEAYEMVQDQALATAIAMGISREETAELIRITRMMQEMKERYNKVSEEEQAAKAVRQTNKEFNNRVAVLNKLASQQGKYTDEQISAILNDNNLSTLFLNPKIDSKSLSQALENARRAANLELQIKVTTEEGKKGLFDELVAEVQDEFNRQEAKIDIDFRLATKNDRDIVSEAQNQIAAIQYQIDDYEAQLKGIEDQEEVINEKYDDRYKALEEVAAANERIQRIRSAELDIADALSRGDIAAAARAQQELRATEAQNRAESQKEMLQRQQEAELARVRSESGMSREQIENKMKALQDEIFGIEESQLEPAQERIRIAEYNKQLQIDALEVSGRTRDEWSQIANLTDIATQNTEEFATNVERALALYEYFVNGATLDTLGLFGDQLTALQDMGIDTDKATKDKIAEVVASINPPSPGTGEIDPFTGTYTTTGPVSDADMYAKYYDPNTDALTKLYLAQEANARGYNIQTASLINGNIVKPSGSPAASSSSSGGSSSGSSGSSSSKKSSNPVTATVAAVASTVASAAKEVVAKVVPPAVTTTVKKVASSVSSAVSKATSAVKTVASKVVSAVKTTVSKVSSAVSSAAKTVASWFGWSSGGLIPGYSMGGTVARLAGGGMPLGSDTIPAMLTPGEFVVRRPAVSSFGADNLEKINRGTYDGGSVYNYNLAVNVKSDSNPDQIARTVMKQIKRVESQRVRGNKL